MNNLNDLIINASKQQVIDTLVDRDEDMEDLEAGLREEVAKEVIQSPFPERVKYEDEMEEPDEIVDISTAYPKNRHRSAEAEMQDRLLTIPRRPSLKEAPWGSLWVIRTGFIEQIALLNITKSEQRGLLRQWSDIQVLASGDGNEEIVEAEQDEIMIKIVSYKSRSDNPEKGIRERTAHITQKNISDQTVTMPKNEVQKSGFLNTILGRKTQTPPQQ